MEAALSEIGGTGVLGSLLVLSILTNAALFYIIQGLHKDARDHDRAILLQLFDALQLVREVRDALTKRGSA